MSYFYKFGIDNHVHRPYTGSVLRRHITETEGIKMTQKDLRIGSVLRDLNGAEHTVIRFDGIFTVTTFGNGENWLVDSHLKHETLVKY